METKRRNREDIREIFKMDNGDRKRHTGIYDKRGNR